MHEANRCPITLKRRRSSRKLAWREDLLKYGTSPTNIQSFTTWKPRNRAATKDADRVWIKLDRKWNPQMIWSCWRQPNQFSGTREAVKNNIADDFDWAPVVGHSAMKLLLVQHVKFMQPNGFWWCMFIAVFSSHPLAFYLCFNCLFIVVIIVLTVIAVIFWLTSSLFIRVRTTGDVWASFR